MLYVLAIILGIYIIILDQNIQYKSTRVLINHSVLLAWQKKAFNTFTAVILVQVLTLSYNSTFFGHGFFIYCLLSCVLFALSSFHILSLKNLRKCQITDSDFS